MIDVTNMRIYELRDYARKIGVQSPTSKTKKQLVDEINLINTGALKPHKTIKGRRPIVSFALGEKNQEFIISELNKLKTTVNKAFDNFAKKIQNKKI